MAFHFYRFSCLKSLISIWLLQQKGFVTWPGIPTVASMFTLTAMHCSSRLGLTPLQIKAPAPYSCVAYNKKLYIRCKYLLHFHPHIFQAIKYLLCFLVGLKYQSTKSFLNLKHIKLTLGIFFNTSFPLVSWEQDPLVPYKVNNSLFRTSGVMHWQSILLQVCCLGGPRDALTQWSEDKTGAQWMRGIFCRASWGQQGKLDCTGQPTDWGGAGKTHHFPKESFKTQSHV